MDSRPRDHGEHDTMIVIIPEKHVEITRCYHQCPYFELDGGPGAAMYCGHPSIGEWPAGYIINHPECDEGFPSACPLLKGTIDAHAG